jgi:hypothetical protein
LCFEILDQQFRAGLSRGAFGFFVFVLLSAVLMIPSPFPAV